MRKSDVELLENHEEFLMNFGIALDDTLPLRVSYPDGYRQYKTAFGVKSRIGLAKTVLYLLSVNLPDPDQEKDNG